MILKSSKYCSLLFITFLQLGNLCYSQKQNSNVPHISFCNLPKYENKLVIIEAVYSGVDEYWGLNSIAKCKALVNVELDYYKDGNAIPEKFKTLFDSTYSSYWNTFLILKIKGRYDSKDKNGYGHLGSNKSRFILDDILEAKLIKRKASNK